MEEDYEKATFHFEITRALYTRNKVYGSKILL